MKDGLFQHYQFCKLFFPYFIQKYQNLNFCSLNINTKKNIEERAFKQPKEENIDDDSSEIEIKGYDISNSIGMQEKIGELSDMNEMNED